MTSGRDGGTGRWAVAAVGALLLALVGCSSDGDAAVADATTAEPTTTIAPAVAASTGCGTPADVAEVDLDARPGDVERTFQSGGLERIYRLGVPVGYDPDVPVPLVLNLHGSGSNALQASGYGDVARAGSERGVLVASPQGLGGQWELGRTGSDADFLIELVDDLAARYCVDLDRVHIVGMSLGAWKAAATGCEFADRFASLALVTVEVFPGSCDPMPVVAFHGTADAVVAYEGRGEPGGTPNTWAPPTLENIANWAESNGCDPEPTTARIGDDVELRRFEGCTEGADVELYTIEGGGHTWPGADVAIGPTTDTIDATALAFDWFEAHPRSS